MHDPRTSTALRQLVDLGAETIPSPWRWSIVTVQATGRIALPSHAHQMLLRRAGDPGVRGSCSRVAWLLARGGPGAEVSVDGRGRVYLPVWLRAVCGAGRVLVGTRATDGIVVVSPTGLLDGLGDRVATPLS